MNSHNETNSFISIFMKWIYGYRKTFGAHFVSNIWGHYIKCVLNGEKRPTDKHTIIWNPEIIIMESTRALSPFNMHENQCTVKYWWNHCMYLCFSFYCSLWKQRLSPCRVATIFPKRTIVFLRSLTATNPIPPVLCILLAPKFYRVVILHAFW